MIRMVLFSMALLATNVVLAAEGLVSKASPHSVTVTADRLVGVLESKGMTVFARIDHGAAAQKVGIPIQPAQLVIFGNPKIGSKLMSCAITSAVDLPQKALIWQDTGGQVWLSYNDPAYLAERHAMQGCDAWLDKVGRALQNFAAAACAP